MLTDSKEVANRLENLAWYFEANRSRFDSLEDAFLAGYQKALEDTIQLIRDINHSQSQSYN